jgi:hypothetical protein
VTVRVEDVRAHCERARQNGVHILMEPTTFEYGERQYNAEDPAGHQWTFSETLADVAPEEWGGDPSAPIDRWVDAEQSLAAVVAEQERSAVRSTVPNRAAKRSPYGHRPAGLPDLSWRGGTVRLRGGWPRTR